MFRSFDYDISNTWGGPSFAFFVRSPGTCKGLSEDGAPGRRRICYSSCRIYIAPLTL